MWRVMKVHCNSLKIGWVSIGIDIMNANSMCSFAGLLGAGVAIATVAIALVGAAAPSYAQQATTKDQFVGTWKVDVLKTTVGDKASISLGIGHPATSLLPRTGFGCCLSIPREAPCKVCADRRRSCRNDENSGP